MLWVCITYAARISEKPHFTGIHSCQRDRIYNQKRFMAFQKSMLHLGISVPRCFLYNRKLHFLLYKKASGRMRTARSMMMSQATAAGARMCQGTFFVLKTMIKYIIIVKLSIKCDWKDIFVVEWRDDYMTTVSTKSGRIIKVVYWAYTLDFQVTPHQLRHTYITNLIAASVDSKTVQYLAT